MSAANDDLVFHMRRVQSAERDLRDLGVVWQMIESSAAISCPEAVATILPTLIHTRERFDTLQTELVTRMAEGQRAELGDELGAKAQCAIDILVRNLYERTADVGFLATDDVVRSFCAAAADRRAAERPAMQRRLREYRAKYTVYDDVALLDPTGAVLVRLDENTACERSSDPIVAAALAAGGWVEHFGPSDLSDGAGPSLRYGHRIVDDLGRNLGVLVLRFRFVDEMQRIFAGVADDRRQVAMVVLDADGRVIATNDQAHVPTGVRMAPLPDSSVGLTFFGGREYLAVRCPSHGYQGYAGPGWRAQAMVSLLTAFRHRDEGEEGDQEIPLDHPELLAIHRDADAINRDLRRVVWNGRLMADAVLGERRRLQAVLSQVNRAGGRTRSRVEDAVRDLYRTSISRARNQARELAALAADIMDRNLYERANDCRWWALSPAIQRHLAAPGGAATTGINQVLDTINGLYTVYSRLVVFDTAGVVQGASQLGDGDALVGSTIEPSWLESVRMLGDSQRYAVSNFASTPLHTHGETYTYLAAIRDPGHGQRLLGGIAIVFHSGRELSSMLGDVIGDRIGFAGFVHAGQQVLAATDTTAIAAAARALAACESSRNSRADDFTAITEQNGVHYACVRVRARGYREFKSSDGYDNQVDAIVALRLGAAERRHSSMGDVPIEVSTQALDARHGAPREMAVFHVGPMRYALPAESVIEAVGSGGLVRTPGAAGRSLGLLEVRREGRSRLVPVVCARKQFGVNYPARSTDGVVLVLRSPQLPDVPALGLRVDDVITVLECDEKLLHPVPAGLPRYSPWIDRLFDASSPGATPAARVLVQVLSPARIVEDVLAISLSPASSPVDTAEHVPDLSQIATKAQPA